MEGINFSLIKRIDLLIRLKCTGSPAQLASRLNISERSLYRNINKMRELGAPVCYDRFTKKYYYEYDVDLVEPGFKMIKSENKY